VPPRPPEGSRTGTRARPTGSRRPGGRCSRPASHTIDERMFSRSTPAGRRRAAPTWPCQGGGMSSSTHASSDGAPRLPTGFRRTYARGRLTLGVGFPLRTRGGVGGEPDLADQVEIARAAEAGGFAALYARDIPLRVPSFGDVGQVYDPWVFLTYLAAHTSR